MANKCVSSLTGVNRINSCLDAIKQPFTVDLQISNRISSLIWNHDSQILTVVTEDAVS